MKYLISPYSADNYPVSYQHRTDQQSPWLPDLTKKEKYTVLGDPKQQCRVKVGYFDSDGTRNRSDEESGQMSGDGSIDTRDMTTKTIRYGNPNVTYSYQWHWGKGLPAMDKAISYQVYADPPEYGARGQHSGFTQCLTLTFTHKYGKERIDLVVIFYRKKGQRIAEWVVRPDPNNMGIHVNTFVGEGTTYIEKHPHSRSSARLGDPDLDTNHLFRFKMTPEHFKKLVRDSGFKSRLSSWRLLAVQKHYELSKHGDGYLYGSHAGLGVWYD